MGISVMIPLFLGGLRGWEWVVILGAVLLLFGGKKIPELMHGLGKGIKSFKQGMNDVSEELGGDDKSSDSLKK